MLTPEFDLIARYFTRPAQRAVLGVGDDCALVQVAAGSALAISTDTLVSGVHFFPDVAAAALGHKALAVNLSDLAAMGATPRWFTLALTLPDIQHNWLAEFAKGMLALADAQQIELIGGDTTRGPLSITITVLGEVPHGQALRRDAAQVGDDIWVSGTLGDAALALAHRQGRVTLPDEAYHALAPHLLTPMPQVLLGQTLRGLAHAAIDVSDGLVADLRHICARSQLAAGLQWGAMPRSTWMRTQTEVIQQQCVLAGGDDYQLCFTAPDVARAALQVLAKPFALTRIGYMAAGEPHVTVLNEKNETIPLPHTGFDHFASLS